MPLLKLHRLIRDHRTGGCFPSPPSATPQGCCHVSEGQLRAVGDGVITMLCVRGKAARFLAAVAPSAPQWSQRPVVVAGTGLVADDAVGLGEPDTLELALVVVGDGEVAPLVDTRTLDVTLEVSEFSGGVTCTRTTVLPGGSPMPGAGIACVSPTGIVKNSGDGGAAVVAGDPVAVADDGGAAPPAGSETSARFSIGASDCCTVITAWVSSPCHPVPVYCWLTSLCGSASGLPEAQRTRGMPRLSTITVVPVCSTDWKYVTVPFSKP
jgi:hypothetical protein